MIKRYIEIANKFVDENKYSSIVVALVFYLLVALFCFTDVYEIFELKLYDLRFKIRPSIDEWDRLSFLDIDENSLTIVGQYPWPRNLYARGLRMLRGVDVAQAGFDMMFFDESPKTIDDKDFESLMKKTEEGGRISLSDLKKIGFDKDQIFADGIAAMNRVILSYTFNDEPLNYDVLERQKKESFKKSLMRFNERSSVKLTPAQAQRLAGLDDPHTKSISYPIPEFMGTAHAFGYVNRYTDIDGTVRKVQMVKMFQGRLYFNLALVMLMDACRVPMNGVEVIPGRRIILKQALNPLTQSVEDISIPIDEKGMMYVTWAGSGQGKGGRREKTFHLVPFFAVLEYQAGSAYDAKLSIGEYAGKLFEQEDRIKSDQLVDLDERLQAFKEEERDADPAMKKTLAASITELKNKMDALNRNPFLGDLKRRLDKARAEYAATPPGGRKLAKWKDIVGLKHAANRTKLAYLKNYSDEIAAVRDKLQRAKGKLRDELNNRLTELTYDRTAMELVIRVEDLADRIALVGLTATGTQDIGAIPLHNEYAGVGTYLNTINTVIQKQFIKRAGWPVNLFLMLIIALTMGVVIQRLDAKKSLVTMLATFIVLNLIVILLFDFFNLWLEQLGIVLSMFMPALAIVGVKFMKEESQKRFIKGAFSYYLSPSVIDRIIDDPESLKLGGEDREITIFFSDVRKFSSIAEKLSAQDLVNRLNEYLTEMTDIILKYDGTVDKYMGDAIMAFYGAPVAMSDHPLKACLAAIEMKKRLRELQEVWQKAGKDEIHARMGIHSGKATVGNMGSRTRMDYTAMGDGVNLASRLEGLNKYYATHVMISGSTYEGAKDRIETRQLDFVRVVGKTEAVPIYDLLGKKGSLPDKIYEMLEIYNRGREYFLKRDWKQARVQFKQALKLVPDDGPSEVFTHRCEEFIRKPPPRTWDGVYVLKGK
ncbi:MAG: hypothetical protein A2176_04600 [Spirochaetes bacterium RBG_13_51_14]|nr:MAG: hypothetical protein A2176_04600 [Spirochaetes bacterium RBG_13_51_14]